MAEKSVNRQALIWLVKFVVLYLLISQVMWNTSWFREQIAQPYTRVVAWELQRTVAWFVETVVRQGSSLYVPGGRFIYNVAPECTGFFGGFFIYLSVVLTLPAPSWAKRLAWTAVGAVIMAGVNLARLTAVLVISSRSPDMFDLVHGWSDVANMLAGGALSIVAGHYLFFAPAGVRAFRRDRGDREK